ncbi:MAG TPA: single-stranded DNA-binding protein [Flavobacterium sp.]|uniref:single-stranded DNA-binding protein n=1 Tax=Flavobacterium sp. TaxID=239 RepID=UPI002C471ABF|nr:single-stranded DNA-binding protein [Flavobacterium sp.]HSD15049.1 single-stranded DNA-binding protein [Flavobacterium sp.]
MKNRVQLIGNVGQDPEVKTINGDRKVASVTIATHDFYYNEKGDKVEQTEWHRVTAWGKTAEIIEKFVVKGKEIGIEGKLSHRSYDDKEGNKKYITEIVASEVLLLGNK